jgi:two-component system, chemotaxis family, CheB/CheR fusion protein
VAQLERERARARDAEEKLAAAQAASRGRDDLIGLISHELRTPLTPMSTAVHILREEPLPERARRYVEVIARNLEAQARLLDEVCDLSRLQRGRIALQLVDVDLLALIEQVIAGVPPPAGGTSITLEPPIGSEALWLRADADRLAHAMANILGRVVELPERNGIVEVRVALGDKHARIVIEVSAAELRDQALRDLVDATQTSSATRGGIGLGLALARGIIEAHGGSLGITEIRGGAGARVDIDLQLQEVPAPPGPRRRDRPARVLLVDDHQDSLTLTRMMLERSGYAVATARSVSEALAKADEGFDVLVSDIALPDGSGLDLMAQLKARGPGVVGIAVSGFGRDEDTARSQAAGYAEHLTKPVGIQRLNDTIQRLLSRSP